MVMFYTTFCCVVSVESEIFYHVKRAHLKHARKDTPIATLSGVAIGDFPKHWFFSKQLKLVYMGVFMCFLYFPICRVYF